MLAAQSQWFADNEATYFEHFPRGLSRQPGGIRRDRTDPGQQNGHRQQHMKEYLIGNASFRIQHLIGSGQTSLSNSTLSIFRPNVCRNGSSALPLGNANG